MLLECESKSEEFSFVYVYGEGCLLKRKGVGIWMASNAWMRRDASHAGEKVCSRCFQ